MFKITIPISLALRIKSFLKNSTEGEIRFVDCWTLMEPLKRKQNGQKKTIKDSMFTQQQWVKKNALYLKYWLNYNAPEVIYQNL